jgi:hypothetical protein
MSLKALFLAFLATQWLCAQTTFEVIHKKTAWPDGKGEIRITADAIEFHAKDEKRSRRWEYQDIQYFDRLSPTEFVLLTYEDVGWQFGRDRQYRFALTSGELSEETFDRISAKIGRPVTNRAFETPAAPTYEIEVKHLHRLGGCEGVLLFTEEVITYETERKKDAREWLLDRDVQSVWSAGPYQLELHVYENNRGSFSKTRIYKFDLKERLNAEFYRKLKLQLFKLEANNRAIP